MVLNYSYIIKEVDKVLVQYSNDSPFAERQKSFKILLTLLYTSGLSATELCSACILQCVDAVALKGYREK